METYIFNAAMLCEECATELMVELGNEGKPDTGDSDDYPQGPYPDGGGEADSPQHCDSCQMFLENSLTTDGENYVREALEEGNPITKAKVIWGAFYDLCVHLDKQPNAEQVAAVLEFKDAYEKSYPDWKGHLRDAWHQGWDDKAIGDGYNGNGYLLRQVRNRFGTAWLDTFNSDEGETS